MHSSKLLRAFFIACSLLLASLHPLSAPVRAESGSAPSIQTVDGFAGRTFDPDSPANDLQADQQDFIPIDGSRPETGSDPLSFESLPVSKDRRELVGNTAIAPYSAVCKLNLYFEMPDGSITTYCGSGFMISADCMLTAAHCLLDLDHGGTLERIEIMPGQNGTESPFGSFDSANGDVLSFYYDERYEKAAGNERFSYDLGLVQLREKIGDQTGWIRLSTTGEAARSVQVLGYPYEYKNQIVEYSQYQSFGQILSGSPIDGMLLFDAQGSGGQSGGPVLDENGEAVAVFTCGMVDEQTDIDTGEYGGTRIDSQRIYMLTSQFPLLQPVYRAYNPNSGEHFYTRSYQELTFICKAGWKDEGVAWNTADEDGLQVYRLYDPNRGDHHYTADENERNVLKSLGWKDEGVSWYAPQSDPARTIYRLYNPNARTGQHHFTASQKERAALIHYGWIDEFKAFDAL